MGAPYRRDYASAQAQFDEICPLPPFPERRRVIDAEPMLTISDLTYRIGGRTLLEEASAQIPDGHRIGLVGRNGMGKTTLLRLITGEIQGDSGDITVGSRQKIGTVSQEAPDGELALIDIVLAADQERAQLLDEAESAGDPHRLGEIHARLNDIDAHAAPARAARILAGLGFDDAAQKRSVGEFSGGWRMRVALASALFAEPDILLLDEPTNHLDLEAALWLESYLAGYPHTLLLVSHDRGLLNRIPTAILHLDETKLTFYGGGYDTFEKTRREAQARLAAQAAKQEEQRQHIQKFVDRFRYKASKARQAQSRLKMLERMEPIAAVNEAQAITFRLPQPEELPPPILTLEGASAGYDPAAPILNRLSLRIDMDDRIALLGANGNGKTTLLRLLSGRLQPLDGRMNKSGKLKVGYFAQNQLEELDAELTAIGQIQSLRPKWLEQQIRNHLGAFGFAQEKAETRVGSLSGGEKARLAIACICLDAPHVLLLDEPTNHLDIDTRAALIQALADYDGAVILVSHDPHLVNACADRLWLVADGGCQAFDGDLDDYRKLLMEQRRREREKQRGGSNQEAAEKTQSRKEDRQARARARAETAHLRKAIKQAESEMEKLGSKRDQLHAELAAPETYNGPADRVAALNRQVAEVEKALEDAEMRWMEASEELEAAG